MAKVIKLSQLTLTPALLASTDVAAPNGKVHAAAAQMIEDDAEPGAVYARADQGTDLTISDAVIGQKARELWDLCAARIAADADTPVRTRGDAIVSPPARP